MTYDSTFTSLIDDVVTASRSAGASGTADPQGGDAAQSAFCRGQADIDPRCAALLSRLLADPGRTGTPSVQFVACGRSLRAPSVGFGTAYAAASLLGRTLLLDARLDAGTIASAAPSGNPVPDAFLPRLYHRQLSHRPADAALLFGHARQDVMNALAAPFRLVVIETRSPAESPAATALAPLCTFSILVVAAALCKLNVVQETARHITAAGGNVIGTILVDAPGNLPGWAGGAG